MRLRRPIFAPSVITPGIVFAEADPPTTVSRLHLLRLLTQASLDRSVHVHSHEITPGRGHFHSRHGDLGRPGDGFDHSRFAQAHSRFSRGRDDRRSEMERSVCGGLCTYAVLVFTLARRFVRPIRKTPNHPAVKPRSRIGLHRYGHGAHVELAFPRPDYFRNHHFKYSDRDGVYRRCHAERKTSGSIRPDWCRIRHRVHVRTRNWRFG